MDLEKTIAVLGWGVSGRATYAFLKARGHKVIAWDDQPAAREKMPAEALVQMDETVLASCACLVTSPGIPDDNRIITAARQQGIEVLCDVELWHRFYPTAKTIGITGTNGKSTLTAMVTHLLERAGYDVRMGGNIGTPVFDMPPPQEGAWTVLELSSFQIERCPTFRPTIAALLNITPDHLDRHKTMERYAAIKASLFEGQGDAVIATDDIWTQQIAQMVQVSGQRSLSRIHGAASAQQQNQNMAIAIAEKAGVSQDDAQNGLVSFTALPHRQEHVAAHNGVAFVNDSKATNAEASRAALRGYQDIVWIVGGAPKEGGLQALEQDLAHVRAACVIGADTAPFMRWLADHNISATHCGDMARAVDSAWRIAKQGDVKTILLSPACASYDQYLNFVQRGDDFKNCVQALDTQS